MLLADSCSWARSGAPRASAQILDPRGRRAYISCFSCSLPFDSFLFVLLSPSQSDILDYAVRAYSLSAKSVRCQYLAEYWQSMSPFHYFLYLTNVFLLIFHTVPHMITYPMASNVSSPKGFPYPYLLHFRVSHCLTRLRP